MHMLEISIAGEIDFGIVGIFLLIGMIALMIVYGIFEGIAENCKERRESRRRNKNRRGYVYINPWR